MTAKEKAKDLIAIFRPYAYYSETGNHQQNADRQKESAKKCALVTVEALIKEHTWKNPISWNLERRAYWAEVKQEIEKL